jgi:hypothetical protein
MSPRANVRSLDAIRYFRPAVVRFDDDVKAALTGLRTELNRTIQWLDHDCPAYWQQQIRNGFDRVAEARTQLSRRQMMTVAGRHPDCIDEKKALSRAKERLELAQEKLRVCRQWSIKAHRAADEYSSRIGRAEQTLSQGVPRMMAILERIVLALEEYTAVERSSHTDSPTAVASQSSLVSAAPPAAEPTAPAEPVPVAEASTEPLAEPATGAESTAQATDPVVNNVPAEPARSQP